MEGRRDGTDGREADRRETDRRTDGQTDRRTDGQTGSVTVRSPVPVRERLGGRDVTSPGGRS